MHWILLNLCILSISLIVSTQTGNIIELLDQKTILDVESRCSFLSHWLAFTDVMIGHHVEYIVHGDTLACPPLFELSFMAVIFTLFRCI